MPEKVSFHEQIRNNKIKSFFLGFLVFMLFISLAYVIGWIYDPSLIFIFVIFALVIALAETLYAYYKGDRLVLKITGAKPAEKPKYAHLINTVEGLAIAAGIPKPKVYVIENADLNAFATGRDPEHSSVAVTTGLIEKLNRTELEGVIGHELSHIQNYDIRFATMISILVGLVVIISSIFMRSMWYGSGRRSSDRGKAGAILIVVGLAFAALAPLAVKLIQLAVSRKREYLADASGAKLTRYPEGLANALEKIGKYNKGKLEVSDAVAHLFFANPKIRGSFKELFSTHPNIESRIKILRAM